MTGSDLIVKALINEGVTRIFGLPGEENLSLLESLRGSSIDFVVTRHEQAAAFMAATHGRLTGKPGVAISTLGPGALNFSTGAAYALLGGMPLILITGQKPLGRNHQGQFQMIDVVSSMRPLTKHSRQIASAFAIPASIRDAFRIAAEERPGPVHLELPQDVAEGKVDDLPAIPVSPVDPIIPAQEVVGRAVSAILAASRPLLMFGASANRTQLAPVITDFVKCTGLPFFYTPMGKGVVSGASYLYMGTAALSKHDSVHAVVDHADLIISVGHEVSEKPPFLIAPHSKRIIHVGFVSSRAEPVYSPEIELLGDISQTLALLAEGLAGKLAIPDGLLNLRNGIVDFRHPRTVEDCFPLLPERIVSDVRRVMPSDGIVALDNGQYKISFARSYYTDVPNTLLLDNALATMGAGLPSAIAAALLYPERRVLSVCGDGGFLMNSQELETAARLRLNLVVIVVEDGAYGMVRCKQTASGLADWGLQFNNPDFAAYAAAYGLKGRRIAMTHELLPALEEAFSSGGIHVIVVPVDYSREHLIGQLQDCKACDDIGIRR
jgi:acetolactate synthase-1/2/3 large subunit